MMLDCGNYMFYLACGLIGLGGLLIIIAFSNVPNKKKNISVDSKNKKTVKKKKKKEQNLKQISHEKVADIHKFSKDNLENNAEFYNFPSLKKEDFPVVKKETAIMEIDSKQSVFDFSEINAEKEYLKAILFDDGENLLNFNSGFKELNLSLNTYNKFKRIDEGKLEIQNKGINFYSEGNWLRIDFVNIENLFVGEKYFALKLKGAKGNRVFLVLEEQSKLAEFIDKIAI